jgi:FkbM family methyltransferase
LSLLSGARFHYDILGLSVFPSLTWARLRGRPTQVLVTAERLAHPVTLRIPGVDLSSLNEVILGEEYAMGAEQAPRTIIDAGAFIGMASVFYANTYPTARILAIEAAPSNYAMLCRNVAPYPNVTPIHAAVWQEETEVGLDLRGDAWGFHVGEGDTRVQTVTIERLLDQHGWETVDLLKVDIEGAEEQVFAEARWLERVGRWLWSSTAPRCRRRCARS